MSKYKTEKQDYYVYIHPGINILPELVGTIRAKAGSTEEQVMEEFKRTQPPIMLKHTKYYVTDYFLNT